MSDMSQLQELMALAQSGNAIKLDGIVEALSTQIQAKAMGDIAEAFTLISDSGQNPRDFISVPVSVIRARQAQQRMELAAQREAQQLKHAQELHELELRRLTASVSVLESSAADLATPVHS